MGNIYNEINSIKKRNQKQKKKDKKYLARLQFELSKTPYVWGIKSKGRKSSFSYEV